MLKCYLVLMVVGLAYALPAEIAAKKEEAAVLTPEKNEQAKLIPALEPQDLAAGAVADAALKPDDKKEGLESSETIWGLGWGGYGRGWGGGYGGGWGGGYGGYRGGWGGGWGGYRGGWGGGYGGYGRGWGGYGGWGRGYGGGGWW